MKVKRWVVYGLKALWWVVTITQEVLGLIKAALDMVIALVDDWPTGEKEKP